MTDDLVSWLRAQLDDDERGARFAMQVGGTGVWSEPHSGTLLLEGVEGLDGLVPIGDLRLSRFMAEHCPARALAEVQAKRAILDLHRLSVRKEDRTPFDPYTGEPLGPVYEVDCCVCGWVSDDEVVGACLTVRILTAVFSDRPGYQEACKP